MKPLLLILTIVMIAATGALAQVTTGKTDPRSYRERYQDLMRTKGAEPDTARLRKLFDLSWDYNMHTYPEWATWVGFPGQNDRWNDNSLSAIQRRYDDLQLPLGVLGTIDRSKLSDAERLNYDLFKKDLDEAVEGFRFGGRFMAINQLGGVQQDVPNMLQMMPAGNVKEYEDILARIRSVPGVVEQTVTLLNKGLEKGITPPQMTLRDVPQQVKNVLVDDPMKSPMLEAFTRFPESIPPAEQDRLRKEAIAAYKEMVAPAFRKLHEYLVDRYIPAARKTIANKDLPDGPDWYAYRIRTTTTTNMTPKEIHELGLSEVKRIRAEMEKVMRSTGFTGTFAEFSEFLRTDKRFFYTDPESLLAGYRDIAKRVDPQLIKLFGKLPRLPYGVIPVPAFAEKSQTTAYYNSGSTEAGRPGYFYANTYDLASRPKWEMVALTLHEAVPGHHLQISLAQEMQNVPEFRKDAGYTAYVEGWGLYAESLGEEMGMYTDPYSKFGQLTYEMWRAIRLVVDTGIHSFGWSRDSAIKFFRENSSKTDHDIEVEVDRYIVWPGQALAYKIGELKIKELRNYATQQLGDKFDIRAFHDQVLGNGAVPLDVLEANIKRWVEERKGKKS